MEQHVSGFHATISLNLSYLYRQNILHVWYRSSVFPLHIGVLVNADQVDVYSDSVMGGIRIQEGWTHTLVPMWACPVLYTIYHVAVSMPPQFRLSYSNTFPFTWNVSQLYHHLMWLFWEAEVVLIKTWVMMHYTPNERCKESEILWNIKTGSQIVLQDILMHKLHFQSCNTTHKWNCTVLFQVIKQNYSVQYQFKGSGQAEHQELTNHSTVTINPKPIWAWT